MPREKWPRVKKALRQLNVSKEFAWQVKEARRHLGSMSGAGASLLPDFTLHNHVHSDNVILLLARLQREFKFQLSKYEAHLLALSAYLHDLGMFFSEERFRQEILPNPAQALHPCVNDCCDCIENYVLEGKGLGEQIREVHNLLSAYMLREGPTIRKVVGSDDVPYLMAICRGHRKADLRAQGCGCYQAEPLGDEVVRVGLLASLLRLADALDFYRDRAPKPVFEHWAPDFLKNPTALGHWLRHYFVTAPYITPQDHSGAAILACSVNFRVPVKQINGESYVDFFRPLFEKHVMELNEKELDRNQYPPSFTTTLNIADMHATMTEEAQDGFRDLPPEIFLRIEKSGCKDVETFLEWLGKRTDDSELCRELPDRPSEKAKESPFYLGPIHHHIERFYNRGSEAGIALECLRKSENIEVTGSRRIGKTWFVRYISHPVTLRKHGMDSHRCVSVYIDCQRELGRATESQAYELMLGYVMRSACREPSAGLVTEAYDGSVSREAFEQALKDITGQGLRTILLLDEFEALARNASLREGFFDTLRALYCADDIDLTYVTTSYLPLVDLLSEHRFSGTPFFHVFQSIRLGLFSAQDSLHLLRDSLRRAGVQFPKKLQESVLEVGGGFPFFLQMAGGFAFDMLRRGEELAEEGRKTLFEVINTAAEAHFKSYWRKLSEQEQYALAILPLIWKAPSYQRTLEHLRDDCLISKRNGNYNYFSALFEEFVRRQQVKGVQQVGHLVVDHLRGQVLLRNEPLNLSLTSYRLLTCLMQQDSRVISYDELCQAIGLDEPGNSRRRLQSNIRSLRRALGDEADCIVTARGEGYMFEVPDRWLC